MAQAFEVAYKGIDVALQQLQRQIDRATANGETVNKSWLNRKNRLESLLTQAEQELGRYSQAAGRVVTEGQQRAAEQAQRDAAAQAETALVGVNWNRLPVEALTDLVGFMGDGSPLSERFDKLAKDGAKKIGDALVRGVALGRNPREIARDIRQAAEVSHTQSLTIARTETLRAYRESSRRSYEENADVVAGWRWVAALGARSCPMCVAMHGTVHPVTEPFGSHPNCRCVSVPLLKGKEQEPFQTGEEWLQKQNDSVQNTILGKTAAEKWRKSEVQLSAFVDERQNDKWGLTRPPPSVPPVSGNGSDDSSSRKPMDELSRRLFATRDVEVNFIDSPTHKVDDIASTLFGKVLTKEDYIELVAAPSRSRIFVAPERDGNRLYIQVENDEFYAEPQERKVFRAQSGQLVVNNANFVMYEDAPEGIGVRVFARQVEMSRRLGVEWFITTASGSRKDPDYVGYYVWPRLGYNADITKVKAKLEADGFHDIVNTNQLFKLSGGAEWWRENGFQVQCDFDLSPTSSMNQILEEYLAERGIVPYE